MGLHKQSSISKLFNKPFHKRKNKTNTTPPDGASAAPPATPTTICANGAACVPAAPACERCAPLESRVAELSAEVRDVRADLTSLKGSVAALQAQLGRADAISRARSRSRRDSYESCWDASSLLGRRHLSFHDVEEGPHSTIGEDEFFDAVESALDRITEDQEFRDKLRKKQSVKPAEAPKSSQHSLKKEVEQVSAQQLRYALAGVDDGVWTIFAEEGKMKMYKREEEVDGLAVDPLKAVHYVTGVTAHEVCWHFWCPDVRLEWETTVENVTILESVDESTAINLQVHKRVWPAAQRDSLFWSHIERQVVDGTEYWLVVNNSTDYASEAARESSDKYVRVLLTVCMTCETEIVGDKSDLSKVTRDQLRCKITYCSVVNPGGWAPTSALRMVYKREYPRFLKRFTGYVIEQCKSKPIMW